MPADRGPRPQQRRLQAGHRPDAAPTTTNPIEPGITDLQPGALTESGAGNVGQLPEVNGIPCNGGNTGLCIGLNQNNPSNTGGVKLPPVPIGVQP